jgi:DNA repair photolyase
MEKSYDYSEEFQIVTQMKSGVAINPSFGCPWDCSYCVQHKDKFYDTEQYKRVHKAKIGTETVTPEDIVSEIMVNPRITSRTPLIFYNFSDPFLPQNTKDLGDILTLLDKRKFTNIVSLVTRTFADMDLLDKIAALKHLKPVVLVSYAGYNNVNIERGPLSKRRELAQELRERGIKTIQYLRPIVREWLEPDQFQRARDAMAPLVDGVVMSGIRLTPEIIEKITSRGLPIPQVKNHKNKFFPADLQEKIIEVYAGTVPVYRYTSCAISSLFGVPDYNAHLGFFKETQKKEFEKCPLPCTECQSKVCTKQSTPEKERVRELLDRIGHSSSTFEITPLGSILVDREMDKYDLSFIRQNTSCHVDFVGNNHHIDQVANMEVESQK